VQRESQRRHQRDHQGAEDDHERHSGGRLLVLAFGQHPVDAGDRRGPADRKAAGDEQRLGGTDPQQPAERQSGRHGPGHDHHHPDHRGPAQSQDVAQHQLQTKQDDAGSEQPPRRDGQAGTGGHHQPVVGGQDVGQQRPEQDRHQHGAQAGNEQADGPGDAGGNRGQADPDPDRGLDGGGSSFRRGGRFRHPASLNALSDSE